MENGIITAVEKLWPFGAFLATSAIAFIVGRERQRWKVDDLGRQFSEYAAQSDRRFDALERRLAAMESANAKEATSIATVVAKQDMLLAAFDRMEKRMDGKADK